MYLALSDLHNVKKIEDIPDELFNAADDAMCQLIDISDPDQPMEYDCTTHEWVIIEDLKEE